MHPILFSIGEFAVGTYGLLIMIGMLSGLWLSSRLARRIGLDPNFVYDLAFVLLVVGFVGARLTYIALGWSDFLRDPLAMILSRQGFVFLGGFVFAVVAAIWFARRRHVPLWSMGDVVAPGLVLAHAFGRIGCFLAGCCFGQICAGDAAVCNLAVRYPVVADATGQPNQQFNFAYWNQLNQQLVEPEAEATLPLIPVQLFETAGNLIICAILLVLWRRRRFSGQIFAIYLALYSILRFGLEFWRGDTDRGLWFGDAISTSQILSILGLIAAVVIWFARLRVGLEPIPAGSGGSRRESKTAEVAEPSDSASTKAEPAPERPRRSRHNRS